ncbi:hypothetical protein BOTBODRAFT_26870 [Botryobasidium botryosum FD-172 SS1]|uniref:Nucleoside diphosphate kinase n=1 Tax=Botryobasidium botryosum (strain FD-172 SS1) TaxID=930990 RepID=A0A067N1Q1_BOTB1|nr:hypothetical protein BOTBODRAFT_26870 [Botryobasidium botryosum FD-172 SS1]
MAIIKPHALKHRFSIEPRILQAGFEIVKERQLAFHPDDPTIHQLFGSDAPSLKGAPVWVYILERKNAVSVWNALIGDHDPAHARKSAPSSIRAIYGQSMHDNAVYGSPTDRDAEIQIATIFASSPPFPPIDLPEELETPSLKHSQSSVRSFDSSILSSLMSNSDEEEDDGYKRGSVLYGSNIQDLTINDASDVAPDAYDDQDAGGGMGGFIPFSSPKTPAGKENKPTPKTTPGGNTPFRARPVPATTTTPSIQPRMSRAAALRAGQAAPSPQRVIATPESIARTFENVPGHKRRESIAVASTAPPVVAPRQTRSSLLRAGGSLNSPEPKKTRPRMSVSETFDNVPGHKRRLSITVASTAPPAIAPRPTRSSLLRAGQMSPENTAAKSASGTFGSRPSTSAGFVSTPDRQQSRRSMTLAGPVTPSPSVKGGAALSRSTSISTSAGGGTIKAKLTVGASPRPSAVTAHSRPKVSASATAPSAFRGIPPRATSANPVLSPPSESGDVFSGPGNDPHEAAAQSQPRAASRMSLAPVQSASYNEPVSPPKSITQPPSIVPRTNKSALLRAAAKLKIGNGVGNGIRGWGASVAAGSAKK